MTDVLAACVVVAEAAKITDARIAPRVNARIRNGMTFHLFT
jgi:hypothetical protein